MSSVHSPLLRRALAADAIACAATAVLLFAGLQYIGLRRPMVAA